MTDDDNIRKAKESVAIVSEIMKAAGDNPNVKEAGENLGNSAVIITKTINNALLPLAAVNFAFDKAKDYFNNTFQNDLSEKAKDIPEEKIVEPKASIAGPTLQGLAFTHEENNLKEMYLSLLATAMNSDSEQDAHPAFVEIIKQLNSEEAGILQSILKTVNPIPVAEVRLQTIGEQGWSTLMKHLVDFRSNKTHKSAENKKLPAMIDNWTRLGLIEVDYNTQILGNDSYKWVDERPEILKLKEQHENEKKKVKFGFGLIEATSFGKQFAEAVGMNEK